MPGYLRRSTDKQETSIPDQRRAVARRLDDFKLPPGVPQSTELARHNILVNSVAPGWVATDMSNAVLESKAGQKMASTVIPLGRAATAEEVAGPILFVASDLANFMTGEVINVNGGAVLCG